MKLPNRCDALAHQLMPLIEETHRLDFELILHLQNALSTYKLNKRRRESLEDLLRERARDLVADSCGLAPAQLETLQKLIEEIDPDWIDRESEEMGESFDNLRAMMEETARQAGIEIDLSDIHLGQNPEEGMRKLHERFAAAKAAAARPLSRKQTKSQLERERKQQAVAEAKQRDLKTLYKQLAKVLHPDLETNPDLRANKEEWMKRLTSAYAAGDLRELLRIELEWLGEESSNLAAAGDEKLKVYSLILKEQIDEVKSRTFTLINEPQYSSLRRISNGFSRQIPRTDLLKRGLVDKVRDNQELLKSLQKGDAVARKILNQWADVHFQEMEDEMDEEMEMFPF